MGSLPGHWESVKDVHICAEELVTLNHRTSRTSSSPVRRPLITQGKEISEQVGGKKWMMLVLCIHHPSASVTNIGKRELLSREPDAGLGPRTRGS